MTRERRILLILLAVVGGGCLLAVALVAGFSRLEADRTQLALLQQRYARLAPETSPSRSDLEAKVALLERTIARENEGFYAKGAMNPYRFATFISSLLASEHINVEQFRTAQAASGKLLDFTVSGSSQSIVSFLAKLSRNRKYIVVPYFHLQAHPSSENLTCEFQIGYLSNEEKQ